MAERKGRIVADKNRDGSVKVTVLDPHSGRVVSQHTTSGRAADADVRKMKESLERSGCRADIIDRG